MGILTIILKVLLLSVAVFIVSQLLPNIKIKNFVTAITVALVFSIINFLLGWLLRLLAFPINFITFGLFNFIIFAFLLWITDRLIDDFKIKDLATTLLAAVLISIINSIFKWIVF